MDEAQLKEFILNEENGLSQSITVNEQTIQVAYRPVDLLICNEVKAKEIKDEKQIRDLKKDYDQNMYFILTLSANNQEIINQSIGNKEIFEKAVKQLAFGMNEHVYMVNSEKDTIPPTDYIYPRMYGGSPATSLLFVFNKDKLQHTDYMDFCLNEFGFGTGNQKFRFRSKDINNTPQLKFSTN